MENGAGSGTGRVRPPIAGAARFLAAAPLSILSTQAFAQAPMEDLAQRLIGGPREAVSASIVLAALVAGLLGLVLAVAAARWALRMRRRLKGHIHALETELAEMRGLVAAEPHLLVVWPASGTAPSLRGSLPDTKSIPANVTDLTAFETWLETDSAQTLKPAISALRGTGTPFSHFIATAAGDRLVADGFANAGTAVMKLRLLKGSGLESLIQTDDREALQRQTDSLKAGLSRAPVLAWLRNRSGALFWVNPPYRAAVGIPAAEPEADAANDFIPDLFSAETREQIAATLVKTSSAHERAQAVVGGARTTFDVYETAAPVGSAGIAVDVTEIDRMRDELNRHIKAHARTLDQMATAVAIFGADQKLTFFNAAFADLWKLDEDWLHQNPSDGEILDHLRDQGRLPEQADYRTWKAKRLDAYKAVSTREDWWHLPDGQSLRAVTEPHPFGGVTHLFENVTEKLALESRYNALFSVQRETLDNLHEGAALFGSDGRLKLSNPSFAKIWQLEPEDLENQPHMDTVIAVCRELTGEDEHWDDLRASVGSVGERVPFDGRIERPDGVVLDYAAVPLPDGATLFTYVDVSDSWNIENALRERNEALLAADRLKTAFISHVSYELRAPLTSIKGFAELLDSEAFGSVNEKQREYVGYIQNSSEKLEQLIDDILDLATIDAGVMQLDLDSINVGELLKSAGGLLTERAQSAGVELKYDISGDFPPFRADERRVKQILYNLLTNAIGFSERGGTVTMGASRDDDQAVLWVADTGRGMSPDVRARVFDRFMTMTEGSQHRGSGLGLSVVKSFVELHGGTVEIESDEGIGTTVRCRLPLAPVVPERTDGPVAMTSEPLIEPLVGPQAGGARPDAETTPAGPEPAATEEAVAEAEILEEDTEEVAAARPAKPAG